MCLRRVYAGTEVAGGDLDRESGLEEGGCGMSNWTLNSIILEIMIFAHMI